MFPKYQIILHTVLLLSCYSFAAPWNPQPIIGILSMPNSDYAKTHGYSQFPASYVKWLESGGARVVPIPFDAPLSTTKQLLSQINGALFTGGGVDFFNANGTLTQFALTGQLIFNESVNAFKNGEIWPLWGTCLGHELISVLGAGPNGNVLTGGFDSENLTLPVHWAAGIEKSVLWGDVSEIRDLYANGYIAMNAHSQGITPDNFNTYLSSILTLTATQFDRKGVEFTASQEGKNGLPIFSTQWHPEKSLFEWPIPSYEYIAHNISAVLANHYPTAKFASLAGLNSRHFASIDDEAAALIYNYNPIYGLSSMFEQLYFFQQST